MCTYKVGGVEVGLQLELFVEADALTLGHLFRCHVDHKPHGGVCVVLLVVTGERERTTGTLKPNSKEKN